MNVYLNNYRRFLFNCKGLVSISDTQIYISNNEFDINEIISFLEECIDINDIFNLVNSENFYKGHSLKEKYLLLIQFFNVFHNYSKNLILKYDVYSTKSIKKTTANIKDCLIHIPNYKNYMLDLLGYIYNKDNSEWYINIEKSFNTNGIFAATCILCGYAHQKLTKIMEETHFPEYEDGIESRHKTILDKENNWICKSCSFSNDFKSVNCEMCFDSHEKQQPMNKLKANLWKCKDCTFDNEINNEICGVCSSGRKLSKAISISSVNSTRSKDEQKAVFSENLPRNITIDQNNKKQMKRQISFETNSINRQLSNRWECSQCTFLNKKENLNCEICSMKLDSGTHTKPRSYSRVNQMHEHRNTANNMVRSSSEHVLIKRQPIKVAHTDNKRINKRINGKPIFYSLNSNGNIPRNTENRIRRSSSEHDLIKEQPDKWACTNCTFHNKKENLNCEACCKERNETNGKPIFRSLNNNKNVRGGHSAHTIRRSSSEYNMTTNQQSSQFDIQERKFINRKTHLNSEENSSKKYDDKINKSNSYSPIFVSRNVPHTSDANKYKILNKSDNKTNSSHQSSNKQDTNADQTNKTSRNTRRNDERELIPSSATNNNPRKTKECKVCRKIIKHEKHRMCSFKALFFCINTF